MRLEGEFRRGRPFNVRGREALLLNNGYRTLVEVTYRDGVSASRPIQKTPAEKAAYGVKLAAAIRRNLIHAGPMEGNPSAVVDVRVAFSGLILRYELVKSSGFATWDQAVLRAIEKTGTLPLDFDGSVPSRLELEFRPK